MPSHCIDKLEKMQQAMKNVDVADKIQITHMHNDQQHFIRATDKQISNIWGRLRKYYDVNEIYENDSVKNKIIGCGVGTFPETDRFLKWDSESEFLWFKDVKYFYKECNYFWLDPDGEIFPSTAESCNLWVDELGFLIAYHTDKYGEYCEKFKMRINCLYNDVNYELLKMKRDRKLYEDKLVALGVDIGDLNLF